MLVPDTETEFAAKTARERRSFAPWNDPAARPLLRVDAVSKRFGAFAAVERVSLDVYHGEFFALLGPSGCGKTTLLRMLAGFETPDAGRILLDGADLVALPPHRRPVNMMFQSYALFPHLTVERNVAFGLQQDRLPKAEIAERVDAALAMVRLESLARRKPQQLSGGERQRVALARALVKRPRLLLLDEPLAALDKKLRQETQFELKELQARLGLTFLIVTHDQEEAMTVADRIGVMNQGQLVQVATPPEIYERPNSRWVAGFIGEINLFEGRVVASDAAGTLVESAAIGKLRVAPPVAAPIGSAVCLAVRPEKLRLSRERPAGAAENAENNVPGEVSDIGYLGDLSVYKVRLAGGAIVKVALANVSRIAAQPIAIGDPVWLTFAADAALILTG